MRVQSLKKITSIPRFSHQSLFSQDFAVRRREYIRDYNAAIRDSSRLKLPPLASISIASTQHLVVIHELISSLGVSAFPVEYKKGKYLLRFDSNELLRLVSRIANIDLETLKASIASCFRYIVGPPEKYINALTSIRIGQTEIPIPIDLVLVQSVQEKSVIAAQYVSRIDWFRAIGAVALDRTPVRYSFTLPFATISFWNNRRSVSSGKTCVITPDAAWFGQEVRFFREIRKLGYDIRCRISPVGKKDEPPFTQLIPLETIEISNTGKRPGLYFEDISPETEDMLQSIGKDYCVKKLSGIKQYLVNSQILWFHRATHIVAPTGSPDNRRYAFSIPTLALRSLYLNIANREEISTTALAELKTPIYRFYVDVDLNWELYASFPALHNLKQAQLQVVAGENLSYSGLTKVVASMFEGDPSPLVSSRSKFSSPKSGHHIVFSNVLIKNDNKQGRFAIGYCEHKVAEEIYSTQTDPLVQILAKLLVEDEAYSENRLFPLVSRILDAAVWKSLAELDEASFVEICRNGIRLSFRKDSINISPRNSSQIIGFGLRSMGTESRLKYLGQLKMAVNSGERASILIRIGKRCQWEILRHARLFDHAVYGQSMGLRLLGTQKPGDNESRYYPCETGKIRFDIRAEDIAMYSIRTHAARVSSLNPDFQKTFEKLPSLPFTIKSLDGLFMRRKLVSETTAFGLELEFLVSTPDKLLASESDIHTKPVISTPLSSLRRTLDGKQEVVLRPYLAKRQRFEGYSTTIILYPPIRNPTNFVVLSTRSNSSENVEIKVRVFIPSPAVGLPYSPSFMPVYAGDNRGPSASEGTSRLDIKINVNPTTGQSAYTANWGVSHSFESSDTTSVPGKPGWWLDLKPGSIPTATDQLRVSRDNASVQVSMGTSGVSIEVKYEGANPLAPGAPSIDGRINIGLNTDGSVSFSTAHDGFPQHTTYINDELIYNFDPVVVGTDPLDLIGTSDQQAEKFFPTLPNHSVSRPSDETDLTVGDVATETSETLSDVLWCETLLNDDLSLWGAGFDETLARDDDEWIGESGSAIDGDPSGVSGATINFDPDEIIRDIYLDGLYIKTGPPEDKYK